MTEIEFEKLLNIQTSEYQHKFNENYHYNRYEPTSYECLNILFKEYKLNKFESVIDFGCGKGRLNFYINYFFNSYVTGIEMNEELYNLALNNKNNYLKKHNNIEDKISFLCCYAQNYKIKLTDNKFYFFNPFSIQIFTKVIYNVLDSFYINPRVIDIILYYPNEDYIYFLESNSLFELYKEILLPNFSKDPKEKFLIYRLSN